MSFIASMPKLSVIFNPVSSFMMKRDWLLWISTENDKGRICILRIINNFTGRIGRFNTYKIIKIVSMDNIELIQLLESNVEVKWYCIILLINKIESIMIFNMRYFILFMNFYSVKIIILNFIILYNCNNILIICVKFFLIKMIKELKLEGLSRSRESNNYLN